MILGQAKNAALQRPNPSDSQERGTDPAKKHEAHPLRNWDGNEMLKRGSPARLVGCAGDGNYNSLEASDGPRGGRAVQPQTGRLAKGPTVGPSSHDQLGEHDLYALAPELTGTGKLQVCLAACPKDPNCDKIPQLVLADGFRLGGRNPLDGVEARACLTPDTRKTQFGREPTKTGAVDLQTRFNNAPTQIRYQILRLPEVFTNRRMLAAAAMMLVATSAQAEWQAHQFLDRITGEETLFIQSDFEMPERRMNFPYEDVGGFLRLRCYDSENSTETASFWFAKSGDEGVEIPLQGYNDYTEIRARLDDHIAVLPVRIWKFGILQRGRPSELAEGLRNHDALLLELPTYFDGRVYFEFDLRGAAELYERHCPKVDWYQAPEDARDPSSNSTPDQAAIKRLIAQSQLERVESSEETESSPESLLAPTDEGSSIPSSISEGLRRAIRDCWNVGSLSTAGMRTVLTVGFSFDINGELRQETIKLVDVQSESEIATSRAFEAARRSIICGLVGGLDLPPESYPQWQNIKMTFDPEQMRSANISSPGLALEATTSNEKTLLHEAAIRGQENVARRLLARGADPNARCCKSETPLHIAAIRGHAGVVKVLLEAGAESEARLEETGSTPLHNAAMNGHVAAVRALLDAGADPNAKENGGWTPLNWAEELGYGTVVRLLRQAGGRL